MHKMKELLDNLESFTVYSYFFKACKGVQSSALRVALKYSIPEVLHSRWHCYSTSAPVGAAVFCAQKPCRLLNAQPRVWLNKSQQSCLPTVNVS